MPIANQRELNRAPAERSGCFQSTAGAAQAPRCFMRKPRLVASAQPSARNMPRCTVMVPSDGESFTAVIRAIGPVASHLKGPARSPPPKLVQPVFPLGYQSNRRANKAQQPKDDQPILFTDVDGVISLFGFERGAEYPGEFHSIDGILHC